MPSNLFIERRKAKVYQQHDEFVRHQCSVITTRRFFRLNEMSQLYDFFYFTRLFFH